MEFSIFILCSLMAGYVGSSRRDVYKLDPYIDQSLSDANDKHFVGGSSMYNLFTKSVELSGGPNENHILTIPCESKANKKYNTVNGKGRDYLCQWDGEYTEPASKQKVKAVVLDGDCSVAEMCRYGRGRQYFYGKDFVARYDCLGGCKKHCYLFYRATINVVQPLPPKYVFQNTTVGRNIYLERYVNPLEINLRDEKDFDGMNIKINCGDVGGKLKQDCLWLGNQFVDGRIPSRNFHDSNCTLRYICQGGNFTSSATFVVSYTEHDTGSNTDTTNFVTYSNVLNAPPPCRAISWAPWLYPKCCEARKKQKLPCRFQGQTPIYN